MNKEIFTCGCGYSWERGQDGSHPCEDGYRKQIQELNEKLRKADWKTVYLDSCELCVKLRRMQTQCDSGTQQKKEVSIVAGVLDQLCRFIEENTDEEFEFSNIGGQNSDVL